MPFFFHRPGRTYVIVVAASRMGFGVIHGGKKEEKGAQDALRGSDICESLGNDFLARMPGARLEGAASRPLFTEDRPCVCVCGFWLRVWGGGGGSTGRREGEGKRGGGGLPGLLWCMALVGFQTR